MQQSQGLAGALCQWRAKTISTYPQKHADSGLGQCRQQAKRRVRLHQWLSRLRFATGVTEKTGQRRRGINLSLTTPSQAWSQVCDGTGDRAGSRKKKPTVSCPPAFSLDLAMAKAAAAAHIVNSLYWQICRRPSSPLNQVPGWQTKPLRAAQL